MLRKVEITSPGDTKYLLGEKVDRYQWQDENARVQAEGGVPAKADHILLPITRASLETDSFLSSASFQETIRVLTEASLQNKVDHLQGLKENILMGRLIPAGTGYSAYSGLQSEIAK
jgi:DNA-directed RNA polymerase subunit beta'